MLPLPRLFMLMLDAAALLNGTLTLRFDYFFAFPFAAAFRLRFFAAAFASLSSHNSPVTTPTYHREPLLLP